MSEAGGLTAGEWEGRRELWRQRLSETPLEVLVEILGLPGERGLGTPGDDLELAAELRLALNAALHDGTVGNAGTLSELTDQVRRMAFHSRSIPGDREAVLALARTPSAWTQEVWERSRELPYRIGTAADAARMALLAVQELHLLKMLQFLDRERRIG